MTVIIVFIASKIPLLRQGKAELLHLTCQDLVCLLRPELLHPHHQSARATFTTTTNTRRASLLPTPHDHTRNRSGTLQTHHFSLCAHCAPAPHSLPTRHRRDHQPDQTAAPLTPPLRTGLKIGQSDVHGSHALASYSNCDERSGTGGSQAKECALECRGTGGRGAATEQEDQSGYDAKRWQREREWCREEDARKR